MGLGAGAGALARGHEPWSVPADVSGHKLAKAASLTDGLRQASMTATDAVKSRARNPTIADVVWCRACASLTRFPLSVARGFTLSLVVVLSTQEDLALTLHEMLSLARQRFEAHIEHIVRGSGGEGGACVDPVFRRHRTFGLPSRVLPHSFVAHRPGGVPP